MALIAMFSDFIRKMCVAGLCALLYHLWWNLQTTVTMPASWWELAACNSTAFYFGWVAVLMHNMFLPRLKKVTESEQLRIALACASQLGTVGWFLWTVRSIGGDESLKLALGVVLAGVIGLIGIRSKSKAKEM